jgi:hypothetical protein
MPKRATQAFINPLFALVTIIANRYSELSVVQSDRR